VLPRTGPTQTKADTGESRQKGAQNGIKERDFSLFCCTFLPLPTFQNTCSLISYPYASLFPHLRLFFPIAVHKKATFRYKRNFLLQESYTSVFACTLARRQQQHQCGFWQPSCSVVIGITVNSPLFLTPV